MSEAKNDYPKTAAFGLTFVPIGADKFNFMETIDHYQQGLLFVTYKFITSDREISDDELYYLHKMRIAEGIPDSAFAEQLHSLIGKSEKEIYQIGIESLNRCTDELKTKAFARLANMARTDKVIKLKDVIQLCHAVNFSPERSEFVMKMIHYAQAA